MKLFIGLLLFMSLFTLTNCERNHPSNYFRDELTEHEPAPESYKSPEELRMELKSSEEAEPMSYLECGRVTMYPQEIKTRRAGLFHDAEYKPDGAIFKGSIKNKATLGRYKDARIKILFYSQTNTLIEAQSYVIYEYLEPQSTTEFSFKTETYPEAYDSFQVELTGASVAEE